MARKEFNKEEAIERRNELKALSATVKLLMNTNERFMHCTHINDALVLYYKRQSGCTELHTFDEWREKGRQVCKGAKGFAVWGRKTQRKAETTEEGKKEDKTQQKSFFPMAYLFDISQTREAFDKK